jgi:pimeloyl-ACP methyl ester carboxylesterase
MTSNTITPVQSATVRSSDGTAIAYHSLGAGPDVIVIGGALRTGQDYLPLARVLAQSFAVHVVDRRGRGASGPQGPGYSIGKECEDLLAVQAATGATAVFGHSYGGLVALETARRAGVFTQIAVYEPGVSVNGSIPASWMPRYRQMLASGDTRGAFACMVRQSGFAPNPLSVMPLWYTRAVLRVVIRAQQWRQMEPLLGSNLAEHEQVISLDDGTVDRYASISARVLLLGGQQSPSFITTDLFDVLCRTIPGSAAEILDGLGHDAPEGKAPDVVGERVRQFCLGSGPPCAPHRR